MGGRGELAKFGIDEREQFLGSLGVALLDALEDQRDGTHDGWVSTNSIHGQNSLSLTAVLGAAHPRWDSMIWHTDTSVRTRTTLCRYLQQSGRVSDRTVIVSVCRCAFPLHSGVTVHPGIRIAVRVVQPDSIVRL